MRYFTGLFCSWTIHQVQNTPLAMQIQMATDMQVILLYARNVVKMGG